MDKPQKLNDAKRAEEILAVAKERFKLAEDAETDIRKDAIADLKFSAGEQWDSEDKKLRKEDNRPCLVINRMPQHIRQITNDQRQNRPSIKVSPVDSKADIETAKIYQGLIRHIEYDSNADVAYDTAFDGGVRKGIGYFRVITAFENEMSFNLKLLIKRIRNSFSVYMDPNSKEPDGSDAAWAFIFEDMPKSDFVSEYGETKLAKEKNWTSYCENSQGWISENTVRVAEYFYKDYEPKDIYLLSNGEIFDKSEEELAIHLSNLNLGPVMEPVTVEKKRKTKVTVVKWLKIIGNEILEETSFPGIYIPVFPVIGDELDIDGKRVLEGVIRHSKDSQKMYNYMASAEAEAIALAPKAPYIVAEGQITKAYEPAWKSANRKNHAYLPYKPTSINQQPVPPPQRNTYEPGVAAITNARLQASEDIKSTTGQYDASMGRQSNETSGIAIQRRASQAQNSTFHFIDNLTRAIKHCGRVLVGAIPHVYDTARTARILGEDGKQEIVLINQEFEKAGQKVTYNLGVGEYDVTVDTGPTFATKRMEASASMMEFTKAVPQHAAMVSDLIAENQDWPGASEFAARLRKLLPPGLIEDKEQKPIPPEIQNQLQQQGQIIEQLTQQLNESTEAIKTKKMELESKERIENSRNETNLIIEQLKLQGSAANELFLAELQDIKRRQDLLDYGAPINSEFEDSFSDQETNPINEQQQLTGELPPGQTMGEIP